MKISGFLEVIEMKGLKKENRNYNKDMSCSLSDPPSSGLSID
jgi:hypothetical protein